MRFFEFKAPTSTVDIKKFLDYIKDPNFNPQLKAKMLAFLQKLDNKLDDKTNEETVADVIQSAESNLSPLQKLLASDPAAKAEFDMLMKKAEDEAFELGASVGHEQGSGANVNSKIKEAIQKLSQIPEDIQGSLRSLCLSMVENEDPSIIIEFLNQCASPDRLVDMPSLVSQSGSGTLPIDSKYKNIASRIITQLKSSSSSHASDGPGEWFLVLVGKDTTKASPGDIAVSNEPVEVKSSGVNKTGSLVDYTTVKTNVLAARKEFVRTINRVTGNTIFQDAELKDGGISSINTRNLKQLNPIFADMGEQETKNLFIRMFELALGKDYKLVENEVSNVVGTIGPNGIDPQKWIPMMKILSFSFYQQMYKYKALISINSQNLNYTVSLTADDFANTPSIPMTMIFDFRPRMSAITSFKQN